MKPNYPVLDRRNFLRASLLGGVALAVPWGAGGPLVAAESSAAVKRTSRVALTAGEDRADLAFQALKPFSRQIAAAIGDKRVILKPNNVVIDRQLAASDAKNLEGILEFLKSIGKDGNVVIAESPAGGSVLEGFANYGYDKVAAKYGAKLMDLDKDDCETLYCFDEKDIRPHPCRMAKTLLDPNNFIISAAKFKTHDRVVATLSLKNIVVGAAIKRGGGERPEGGRWGNSDKPVTHGGGYRGINYNLAALASRLHPHLAVIDGYEGMEGEGPASGTPVNSRVCVVSPDWLAADRVAVELMGIDFGKIGYLNYCAQTGLGEADLSKIEIVGPALKDYIKPYKLAKSIDQQLIWMKPVNNG
ncbi:MAG: DUF362 domain-containing protein [Limisphaerales bacterium]